MTKMKMLDVTQSAILGVLQDRRGEISHPTQLKCDGCGIKVFVSRQMLGPAKESAKVRRHRLYKVCPTCVKQFTDHIARAGGEIEASSGAMPDAMLLADDVLARRRAFLRSN
jgi:hypothetical protein